MICPNCKHNAIPFSDWGKNMTGSQQCPRCGQHTRMGLVGWLLVIAGMLPWVWFLGSHLAVMQGDLLSHSEHHSIKYGQIPLLLLIIPFCIAAGRIGLKKTASR